MRTAPRPTHTHPNNAYRVTPHIVLCCALLLSALFALSSLNAPAALAQAEPERDAAAGQVVEYWHGTVLIDETDTDTYISCPGAWVCPGNGHKAQTQTWRLQVTEDGTVTGSIQTQVTDFSYEQTETNINCGPVAETNYILENCQYAGQLTQPNSMMTIQGVRKIQEFTNKPILEITAAEESQECETSWTARGIHSITGAVVHKQDTDKCSSPMFVPRTFEITTYEDGRASIINLNDFFSCCGSTRVTVGHLTVSTEPPLLELDRELLERSVFLDQVPVDELFTANMNWNSPDGGWLSWQLEDAEVERIGPTDADELPKSINNGAQGLGRKRLTVQAKTTLKKTSEPEVTQVVVGPSPGWTGGPSQISAAKQEDAVLYKSTRKYPEPPFKGKVNVPSIVPFMGGKELGLTDTQGSFSWEAMSTSEGQGSLSGQTGFTAMGEGLVGSLGGRAKMKLDETGVHIEEGGMDFSIGGTMESKKEPLLKLIPQLRVALTVVEKIAPSFAAAINERAFAKLELSPKFDFGFTFFTENDEIKFKNAEAKPSITLKTIVQLDLIPDALSALASISGGIVATFQVPEPYIKGVSLQGVIAGQITLWREAFEAEKSWSVAISGAGAALASAGQMLNPAAAGGSWQPLDNSYTQQPNYATWHGDEVNAAAIAETAEGEPIDLLRVENVSPLANPSLFVRVTPAGGTNLIQTWVHDRPDLPAESSGEIRYSTAADPDSSWQSPQNVTNDEHDDLAPKVVILNNGRRLFVWQRMDTPTPPDINTDPEGYVSHWQIFAQQLAGTAAFEQLSTPGSLSYRHQLSVLSDGAMAVWVNNPGNQILGDSTKPDFIRFARYTTLTDKWDVTGTVVSNVAGLVSLDLATNGNHAALVYALDTNNDLTTTADLELFYVTWNGTSWGTPAQLTSNSVPDESPELQLAADGTPLLVWRQGETLQFLAGAWGNTATTLPLPGAAERYDYDLVQSSNGALALVWQEAGPEDTRVGYAIYDPVQKIWSSQRTLTPPAGYEGSMATSIAAAMMPPEENEPWENGALVVAYQLVHISAITKTVNGVETETGLVDGVSIPNTIVLGQHDLRVATLPHNLNLTVTAADLSIPAPDTIQAVIRNTGELAVVNAPVVLHVGAADPVSGVTQQIAQTIPLLAAGSATTLTFAVADPNISLFAVEIDPDGTLLESDTTDNMAVLGTDIAIAPLSAHYGPQGTTVRSLVTQNGHRYISVLAPAILTLESPDGITVGGGQVGFPLEPTHGVTLTAFVSTTMLGAGRHPLYWNVDPEQTLGEFDRSNNVAGTTIMILPDLSGVQDQIDFGTVAGSTAPFRMTAQNMGNWPSSESTLEVFDGLPSAPTTHSLLRLPMPVIKPGAQIELSGTLQLAGLPAASNGLSGIYIQLDTDGVIEESNENNNLLASGDILEFAEDEAQGGSPLYLPTIQR